MGAGFKEANMTKALAGFAALSMGAIMGAACSVTPMEPGDPTPTDAGSAGGGGSGGATTTPSTLPDPAPVMATGGAAGGNGGASGSAGATGGVTCAAQAVTWKTNTVSLEADAFWIVADGKCFDTGNARLQVHSDPGWSQYTTLELTWDELDREMRWFVYFKADASGWWSEEMRTYDGQQPHSDWLFYYGTFFKSPIGQAFHGDIDLANDAGDAIRGELHVHGMTLSTTLSGK
jgi:hypothetical protein